MFLQNRESGDRSRGGGSGGDFQRSDSSPGSRPSSVLPDLLTSSPGQRQDKTTSEEVRYIFFHEKKMYINIHFFPFSFYIFFFFIFSIYMYTRMCKISTHSDSFHNVQMLSINGDLIDCPMIADFFVLLFIVNVFHACPYDLFHTTYYIISIRKYLHKHDSHHHQEIL